MPEVYVDFIDDPVEAALVERAVRLRADARGALVGAAFEFQDDQPRDEQGRWTSGGGDGPTVDADSEGISSENISVSGLSNEEWEARGLRSADERIERYGGGDARTASTAALASIERSGIEIIGLWRNAELGYTQPWETIPTLVESAATKDITHTDPDWDPERVVAEQLTALADSITMMNDEFPHLIEDVSLLRFTDVHMAPTLGSTGLSPTNGRGPELTFNLASIRTDVFSMSLRSIDEPGSTRGKVAEDLYGRMTYAVAVHEAAHVEVMHASVERALAEPFPVPPRVSAGGGTEAEQARLDALASGGLAYRDIGDVPTTYAEKNEGERLAENITYAKLAPAPTPGELAVLDAVRADASRPLRWGDEEGVAALAAAAARFEAAAILDDFGPGSSVWTLVFGTASPEDDGLVAAGWEDQERNPDGTWGSGGGEEAGGESGQSWGVESGEPWAGFREADDGTMVPDYMGSREATDALDYVAETVATMARDGGYDDMPLDYIMPDGFSGGFWGENADGPQGIYRDAVGGETTGTWGPVDLSTDVDGSPADLVGAVWMDAGGAAERWQEGDAVAGIREAWDKRDPENPNLIVGTAVDDPRHDETLALFLLMDRAPTHDGTLYREMFVQGGAALTMIETLQPGIVVEGQLAGWSANPEVASIFGGAYASDIGYVRDVDPYDGSIDISEAATSALVAEPYDRSVGPNDYIVHMEIQGGVPALPVGLVSAASSDVGARYAWQQEHLVGVPLEVAEVRVYPPETGVEVFGMPTEDDAGNPIEWQTPGTIVVTMKAAG